MMRVPFFTVVINSCSPLPGRGAKENGALSPANRVMTSAAASPLAVWVMMKHHSIIHAAQVLFFDFYHSLSCVGMKFCPFIGEKSFFVGKSLLSENGVLSFLPFFGTE